MPRIVLVCKNTTCSQQGSAKVLSALQAQANGDVSIKRSGCLGECGNGPMVLVMPEETWYSHVEPADVSVIVSQHLKGGKVVKQKLYPKFHPQAASMTGWLIVFGILLVMVLLIVGAIAGPPLYSKFLR